MPALSSSSACLVDTTFLPLQPFASNRHRLLPVNPSSFRKAHLRYFTLRTPRDPTVRPTLYASTNPFVEDAEEIVVGDCVVFEDGIFDDPFLHQTRREPLPDKPTRRKKKPIVLEENLVPDKWKDVQAEINLTKKDKRRMAREAEFASRLEKYRKKEGGGFDVERYASYRSEKLSQLRPLVLDEPDYPVKEACPDGDAERRYEGRDESASFSGRVAPRNPRLDVSGDSFQEIKKSLESNYEDGLRDSQDLWWDKFGIDCPNLTKLAIRVLSQTCSASGCERNWSVFEHIHTKKRNRLEHRRLNDLVYIRCNMRLRERQLRKDSSSRSGNQFDPISLDNFEALEEWIQEEEEPVDPLFTNDDAEWINIVGAGTEQNEDIEDNIQYEPEGEGAGVEDEDDEDDEYEDDPDYYQQLYD